MGRGLEQLGGAVQGGDLGPAQQGGHAGLGHGGERPGGFQRLIQDLHAVDAGDDDRDRQGHRVVQHFGRGRQLVCQDAVEDEVVAERLHRQDADPLLGGQRQHLMGEAAEVGVHDIDGHLDGVEVEAVLVRDFQHPPVDERVFVAGEADEADLAGLPRFQDGFQRTALGEDAVRVLHPQDFVELDQVQVVRLEPRQRLVELTGRRGFGTAVELGHQEHFPPVAALRQRLAHADLAVAVVVVPAVVQKVDAPVHARVDELDPLGVAVGAADVEAAHADERDLLAGPSEHPVRHVPPAGAGRRRRHGGGGLRGHVRLRALRQCPAGQRQARRRPRQGGPAFEKIASCGVHRSASFPSVDVRFLPSVSVPEPPGRLSDMQTLSRFLPVNAEPDFTAPTLEEKYASLRETLRGMGAIVIGFSGGADSALLARVAHDVLGDRALAVIALSPSYPKRERDDALDLAAQIGVPVLTVDARELENEAYAANPTNRCYFCKAELFTHLARVAGERGIRWIAYGANHDDLGDHRPGHQAAREFGARAPLLEVGMTKPEIRHLSKALGLATWDKPALACLSSRFPYGTRITAELLARLDAAEDFLRHDLGFRQVRVRHHDTVARLEVDAGEMDRLLDPVLRGQISARLKALGYTYVAVELGGYKSGSLNANIEIGAGHGH